MTAASVEPLWVPSPERQARSRLAAWCAANGFNTYQEAWEWSVGPGTMGEFWQSVADDFAVRWASPPRSALEPSAERAPAYRWFPGGRLNYAEHALRGQPAGAGDLALSARSQTRPPVELTWAQLCEQVSRARAGLLRAGIAKGDRVAAYLPNIPEALVTMLACASIGAIWTCCSPEMGVPGALERLTQVAPAVFLSIDGYRYGRRVVERAVEGQAILDGLPSVRQAVWVPYLYPEGRPPAGWEAWDDLVGQQAPLEFADMGFEEPLYILFSSGTTGKPKPIVHGHGGILLEHLKALGYHFDLGPGDRFFWFSTTSWMMWNFCTSGLLVGSTVVLFDGDPNDATGGGLWEIVASTGTTCAGVGASFLVSGMKSGARPGEQYDLSRLLTLGSTGSPLPASAGAWAYDAVGSDLMLASFSGGTDVCTGFVGPSPLHPVWAGEISCRCLGAKAEVFDQEGRAVVGEEGELVLSGPLPSMPVGFWGDDGSRYRASYFERFPHVWAHGDRATLTERGTVIITGRSDGTLKRGGVRMGTAEFYSVVEMVPEVDDSLVVHLDDDEGGPGELWLFLAGPCAADRAQAVTGQVRAALRTDLSPRYVPDRVEWVPAVPRTLSGKKLEVPVKRILSGVALEDALAVASVANPESLAPFVAMAEERRRSRQGTQD